MDEQTARVVEALLTENEIAALVLAFVRARGVAQITAEDTLVLIDKARVVLLQRLNLSLVFQGASNVDLVDGEMVFSKNEGMQITQMTIHMQDEAADYMGPIMARMKEIANA